MLARFITTSRRCSWQSTTTTTTTVVATASTTRSSSGSSMHRRLFTLAAERRIFSGGVPSFRDTFVPTLLAKQSGVNSSRVVSLSALSNVNNSNNNNANNSNNTTFTRSHCRSFHASAMQQQAVRRRRRRGQAAATALPKNEDDENDNNNNTDDDGESAVPRRRIHRVTDPEIFEQVATALVDKIFAALAPLQAVNDPFVLTRDRDPDVSNGEYILLDLGPLHGQYTLQVDPEQALVHLQSPISGIVQYYRSSDDDEWRSVEDGHILEGLLVRDLIRQIKGVPRL